MTQPHPAGQSIGIQLANGLSDRHGDRARHGGLGRGHLQLSEQRAIASKATQLDRGTAQIHPDQLIHQNRRNNCNWAPSAPWLSMEPCRLINSEAL